MPTGNFMRFTSDANFTPIAVQDVGDGTGRFALSTTSGSGSGGGTVISTSGSPLSSSNPLPVNTPVASAANTPTTGSGSTALSANTSRKTWSIQNLGTNPLFVRLGAGATTSVFHVSLKGATAQDDGSGGYFSDILWQGIVSIAGTSPRYTVTELT